MFKFKKWLPKKTGNQAPLFSQALDFSPPIKKLLLQRELHTPSMLENILNPQISNIPTPKNLLNMGKSVERILKALSRKEKIVLYGDYDVDGFCALAILWHTIKELKGPSPICYIPKRIEEGYGLNKKAISEFKHKGVSLVITVDCGIRNHKEALFAQKKGLDLIITDHHKLPDKLPPVENILHPQLTKPGQKKEKLSGAAVAFKLSWALMKKARSLSSYLPLFNQELLDLVGIATIADMVPLRGENHLLAKLGLQQLQKVQRPGIRALLDKSGRQIKEIDEKTIGFQIAPRLNAGGRLGKSDLSLNILLKNSYTQACQIADQLDQVNQQRRQLVKKALRTAKEKLNNFSPSQKVILIKDDQWHPGIIGLMANKLADQFNCPAFVVTQSGEELKGSVRTCNSFDLTNLINPLSNHFTRFGGHKGAAGFSLTKDNYENFAQALNNLVGKKSFSLETEPVLEYDLSLQTKDIGWTLLKDLEKLKPFGPSHKKPVFVSSQVPVTSYRLVGKTQKHLKLKVQAGQEQVDAIGFNLAKALPLLQKSKKIDLAFYLEKNIWRNKAYLQLNLVDLQLPNS